MTAIPTDPRFALLVAQIDPAARLLRAWPLKGGISAQVTALAVMLADGSTQTWVVRRHGVADLTANPGVAALEHHLLRALHAEGLPVPAPLGLEASGTLFGQPALVLAYVEGAPDFAPSDPAAYIEQVAAALARIHLTDLTCHALPPVIPPLPLRAETVTRLLTQPPSRLNDALNEGRIRAALGAAWPLTPRNTPALLHGDYWPGNWLWRDGRLVAIIDWEDAAQGDPLADLANARLELWWALGEDAADIFTAAYQAQMQALDLTHLPYWELVAALRPCGVFEAWAEDVATRERMRATHAAFVARALAAVRP